MNGAEAHAGHAGLDGAEAARRLAADGTNALPDHARRGWIAILAEGAREPMFLPLGAVALYLLLVEPRESLVLLLLVLLMVGMTLYQEGRTRAPACW